MSTTAPAHPLGLDPLIAEAKARARRRRLIALGLVALAAAAVVGVTLATRTSPRKPAVFSLSAEARNRVPIWDFGVAGGGVTWAINGRDLWLTVNQGRSWRATRIPSLVRFPGFFAGAKFVDHRHGWAFGFTGAGSGAAYRTADGGRSWQRVPVPRASGALAFVTEKRGYNVRRGELFETRDGGMSWQPVSRLGAGSLAVWLDFATARRGFAETQRALFATDDGGKTWSRKLRIATHVADAATLWAPTVFGPTIVVPELVPLADPVDGPDQLYMHVSRNDGLSWSVRRAPKPIRGMGGRGPNAPSLSVVSPNTWVAAGRSTLYVTTDAGRHWRTVRPAGLPRGWGYHLSMGFTSARDGWALFSTRGSDVLTRTTDGGKHWASAGPLKPQARKRG